MDVSQMRGPQALVLSGLLLRRIFDRNQAEFTNATPETIPTIAVIEEAQSVLDGRATSSEPYITWVKEGRKYDLGAVLITQQPGSIPVEILSQGDNWFVFHLLSAADLQSVKRANAHFSDDILAVLLNEPIPGQGVFWSSAAAGGGMAYPIPMRALLFEDLHTPQDPHNTRGAVETFASQMRDKHRRAIADALQSMPVAVSEMDRTAPLDPTPVTTLDSSDRPEEDGIDFKQTYETAAFARLVQDAKAMARLRSDVGASYGWVKYCLASYLPERAFRNL